MKTERVLISFIAVVVGVLAAGVAFYFYQSTRTIPSSKNKIATITSPTPTSKPSIFLSIDSPKDEAVFDTKTIKVSGKTTNDATVVISTESNDQVVTPTSNGNFSATITIDDDQNQLQIIAIAPNGEEVKKIITVTFSAENF